MPADGSWDLTRCLKGYFAEKHDIFKRSRGLTLDKGATRRVTVLNWGSHRSMQTHFVYINLIKRIKCNIHYTNLYFILNLYSLLTPGIGRRKYWPNLGGGSKSMGNTDIC